MPSIHRLLFKKENSNLFKPLQTPESIMAKAKKVSKVSKIKKEWYPIVAPKVFNNQIVGETLVGDASKAIGKKVPVNLSNLTGNMRKQNVQIDLSITSINDQKAQTDVIGYRIVPASMKRMVRRGKNKVETNIEATTSDGKNLHFKVIIITNKLTYLSVQTSLRRAAKENLQRILKKIKFDELVQGLTSNKLQIDLKKLLSKTYPTRICEVKQMKVIEKKKAWDAEEKPEEKAEKKAEKPKKTEKKVEKPKEKAEPKAEEAPKAEKEAKTEKPAENKE